MPRKISGMSDDKIKMLPGAILPDPNAAGGIIAMCEDLLARARAGRLSMLVASGLEREDDGAPYVISMFARQSVPLWIALGALRETEADVIRAWSNPVTLPRKPGGAA